MEEMQNLLPDFNKVMMPTYWPGVVVWALMHQFCDGIPPDKMWREVKILSVWRTYTNGVLYQVVVIGTDRYGFAYHQNTKFRIPLANNYKGGFFCPICQESADGGHELKCMHKFHIGCINTWYRTQKTCPCCRYKIIE